MSVGLVIPTLNAEKQIKLLLDSILQQSVVPDDILVIDSSSDDNTIKIVNSYPGVRAMTIPREQFDHGGTRHIAFSEVSGDYVLFLTQDAVPADTDYVKKMVQPFSSDQVALVTGRQIPNKGAKRFIQLVQEYNYPPYSMTRVESDIPRLGIKAFFASDVCSAYRRKIYRKVGGFPRPCSTNEDMLICARILRGGYSVVYNADARVIHSHNLSPREQYRRNKAVGHFLNEYSAELNVPSEVSEGRKLVINVSRELIRERKFGELMQFAVDCGARIAGNRIGRVSSDF